MEKEPDPRWANFVEVLDEKDKAIGFNLPDNTFLFKYDQFGGWHDEKGSYYNSDGVLVPDQQDEDADDQNDSDEDLE